MATDTEETTSPAPEPTWVKPHSIDWILQTFAMTADSGSGNFGMDLTLTLPGAVVTGIVCSPDSWYKGIAAEHEALSPIVGTINEMRTKSDDAPLSSYEFLHLRDAAALVGGQFVPHDRTFWRLRISEVTGWSFGSVSHQVQSEE